LLFKKGFATQIDRPGIIDPDGFMLAFLHSSFHPKTDDPLKFFDADPNNNAEVQQARERLMTVVRNLQPTFTYLINDVFEGLFDAIISTVNSRLVPSFPFPSSYVAYHLHVCLAAFTTNARLEETPMRWTGQHLREMFQAFVSQPFGDAQTSQEFYTALSHQFNSPPVSKGNKREQADQTPSASKKAKKDKRKTKAAAPSNAPTTAPTLSTTGGAGTSAAPPHPGPTPSVAYCRTSLLEQLELSNGSGIAYKCTRPECKSDPNLHSRITVSALSTRKEIEDFMATPLSLAMFDSTKHGHRSCESQRKAILAFAAKRP
jgi:hypothetical protein